MGEHFRIVAIQSGKALPIVTHYSKVIWSGLSCAAGEVQQDQFVGDQLVQIRVSSADRDLALHLNVRLYSVKY